MVWADFAPRRELAGGVGADLVWARARIRVRGSGVGAGVGVRVRVRGAG